MHETPPAGRAEARPAASAAAGDFAALAAALAARGDWAGLEAHCRRALAAAGPGDRHAPLRALAGALMKQRRLAEAEPVCRELIARDGADPGPRTMLAAVLHGLGRADEARRLVQELLPARPDDPTLAYLAALLGLGPGGEAAAAGLPPASVRALFDSVAGTFEAQLVGGLGYRTPELLLGLLDAAAPGQRFSAALDLGCGTGLMGALLRPRVEHLTGVNLSPGMIEQARRKQVYDALDVAEIVAWLEATAATFELVAAADVLVYLGDLGPLLRAAAARLEPGGLVLVSTEAGGPEDRRLLASGRFRHNAAYVARAAAAAGLVPRAATTAPIRRQGGAEVTGGLFLLEAAPGRRPARGDGRVERR